MTTPAQSIHEYKPRAPFALRFANELTLPIRHAASCLDAVQTVATARRCPVAALVMVYDQEKPGTVAICAPDRAEPIAFVFRRYA